MYFNLNAGVISYGTLRAVGTEQDRILFTSALRLWKNIAIAGRLASNSAFEHCTISNGFGRKKIPETEHFEGCNLYRCGGAFSVVQSNPTIRHCKIENNKAEHGGGIYLGFSNPFIEGNTIQGNQARYGGGGLHIIFSDPVIEGNSIERNKAEYWGGGVQLVHSNPSLDRNKIEDNKPDNVYESQK